MRARGSPAPGGQELSRTPGNARRPTERCAEAGRSKWALGSDSGIGSDGTADTQRTRQPETGRRLISLTVFGATGGIGGHVVRQALDAGHRVTAVGP